MTAVHVSTVERGRLELERTTSLAKCPTCANHLPVVQVAIQECGELRGAQRLSCGLTLDVARALHRELGRMLELA